MPFLTESLADKQKRAANVAGVYTMELANKKATGQYVEALKAASPASVTIK